ncbi:MAG: hypothetical protein EB127_17910 [Alphaproteobacteria bacterium]|jgi:hypothetical protein|nr:hypothetical protein [Alphaproteobacteria bacterium]
MGKKTGASRKMLNLGSTERLENKEYFDMPATEAANDPWSKETISSNFEKYRQNPFKYIEEMSKKQRSY